MHDDRVGVQAPRLIRQPPIGGVIAVAIGVVIVGILIMGMFIVYNTERDRIAHDRETSTEIQGDRIREDVGGTLGLHGNINLTNDWGAATTVNGIMVRCDDGRVITSDEDIPIPSTGITIPNTSTLMDDTIRRMLAECGAP